MKTVFTFLLGVLFFSLSAQKEETVVQEEMVLLEKATVQEKAAVQEEEAVQRTIESFFSAFHEQDSTDIKQTVHEDIVMRRIAIDSSGSASYRKQDFSEFLKAIVAIPDDVQFEEVINSYTIQIDGPLAQVWTPYSFLINGKIHHCGTNAFQLYKEDKQWKIIYIIDTGREEGCE